MAEAARFFVASLLAASTLAHFLVPLPFPFSEQLAPTRHPTQAVRASTITAVTLQSSSLYPLAMRALTSGVSSVGASVSWGGRGSLSPWLLLLVACSQGLRCPGMVTSPSGILSPSRNAACTCRHQQVVS